MEFEKDEGAFNDIANFLAPPFALFFGDIAISAMRALVAEQ